MEKLQSQRGQALAEYMPTFAGFFALSILALWGLGSNLRDLYQDMVDEVISASNGEATSVDDAWEESEDESCVRWETLPGSAQCSQSEFCELEEYEDQEAITFMGTHNIETLVIKAGTEYIILPGQGDYYVDNCMEVHVNQAMASFLVDEDSGPDCRFISNIQSWAKKVCVDYD